MSWFTDRRYGRGGGTGEALAAAQLGHVRRRLAGRRAATAAPPLAFDEGEMARMATAVSLRARQDAQAACAADPATRLAQALEQWPRPWPMPAGGRRKRTPRPFARRSSSRRRLPGRRLRSTVPPVRSRTGSATCWRDWTARAAARLVVSPNAVEGLRPLLPELAARAGLAGEPRARVRSTAARGCSPAALAGRLARARSRRPWRRASPSSWPPTIRTPRLTPRLEPTMSTTQPDLPAAFAETAAGTPPASPRSSS